jgi:hypothetical protein
VNEINDERTVVIPDSAILIRGDKLREFVRFRGVYGGDLKDVAITFDEAVDPDSDPEVFIDEKTVAEMLHLSDGEFKGKLQRHEFCVSCLENICL